MQNDTQPLANRVRQKEKPLDTRRTYIDEGPDEVIRMGRGDPDLDTPAPIVRAGQEATANGAPRSTHPSEPLPLRQGGATSIRAQCSDRPPAGLRGGHAKAERERRAAICIGLTAMGMGLAEPPGAFYERGEHPDDFVRISMTQPVGRTQDALTRMVASVARIRAERAQPAP